jgi:hypothetical protein
MEYVASFREDQVLFGEIFLPKNVGVSNLHIST